MKTLTLLLICLTCITKVQSSSYVIRQWHTAAIPSSPLQDADVRVHPNTAVEVQPGASLNITCHVDKTLTWILTHEGNVYFSHLNTWTNETRLLATNGVIHVIDAVI